MSHLDEQYRNRVGKFLAGEVVELPEVKWGPIGREVYDRTYSRPIFVMDPDQPTDPVTGEPNFLLDQDGQRTVQDWWDASWPVPTDRHSETWAETCRRVVLGNLGFVPSESWLWEEAIDLFIAMYGFELLPAGRHLWATGVVPSVRNCFRAGWSAHLNEHFNFLASRLFEGGGVGANYSNDYLTRTEPVDTHLHVRFHINPTHADAEAVRVAARDAGVDVSNDAPWFVHVVVDTREGWVEAWDVLFKTAVSGAGEAFIEFDMSDVRRYGAALKTFGGTASGPAPFVTAVNGIVKTLNESVGRRINTLEAMQCDHEIASAVCAGGTRRSARMSIKLWSDDDVLDFINCKADHQSHWSTNISVEVNDDFFTALDGGDPHAHDVLHAVTRAMLVNGEPGLYNSSLAGLFEEGDIRSTNPCGEIPLNEKESCNIGSVNLSKLGNDHDRALDLFAMMSRFLYRATFTPIANESQRVIENANRRIGVGLIGLQQWCIDQGFKLSDLPNQPIAVDNLRRFRQVCRVAADDIADTLGTPHPIKVTAIAPTGSISQLPGDQPSFEPILAKYFIRNVRFQSNDPQLVGFERDGYVVRDDIYSANTRVVSFPTKHRILDVVDRPELVEEATDISFAKFLELQATITDAFCGGSDGNAVSATANLPALDATDEIVEAFAVTIRSIMPRLKGMTAFPAISRPMSPIEAISRDKFDQLRDALFDVQLGNMTGDSNDGSCSTGACPVK